MDKTRKKPKNLRKRECLCNFRFNKTKFNFFCNSVKNNNGILKHSPNTEINRFLNAIKFLKYFDIFALLIATWNFRGCFILCR